MTGDLVQLAFFDVTSSRPPNATRGMKSLEMLIGDNQELGGTLVTLLEQVIAQLGVDAASVLLLDHANKVLEPAASLGFLSPDLHRQTVRIGEGLSGWAALEGRLVAVPDLFENSSSFGSQDHLEEEGFVAYFAVPLRRNGHATGVLEVFHRDRLEPAPEWFRSLKALAGQTAIAIENASLSQQLQRSNVELTHAYDATIEAWSRLMDMRDKETEEHVQRVTEVTLNLARAVGIGEEELVNIRRGALLHDIGKLGVPDRILTKPGALTDEEWAVMKNHPLFAFQLIWPISYLRPALDIPYAHHEKWDGSGYPRGLKSEEIPLAARIFAVADVWDALLSNRPYRGAWPNGAVRDYILQQRGAHFDPTVVDTFLDLKL